MCKNDNAHDYETETFVTENCSNPAPENIATSQLTQQANHTHCSS